jgi:hypothetical protein
MTTRTNTPTLLDPSPMSVRAKLAAAWTSFMFLYIYVDILNFYKPGVVDSILDGLVWRFEVSPILLTVMLASVAIPGLMVLLSVTLPARVNRMTNLVIASLYIPYSLFNAAGTTWEWVFFYVLSVGAELVLLAFILRSAWTWPRASVGHTALATTDLRSASA